MNESKKTTSSSVENALKILKSFSMDEPELGVTDIAEKLNIAKSTAHRLLTSLASEGFVYKDMNSNYYSLGASILRLTNIVSSQLKILNEATPVLNVLTEETGENSHISILEGKEIIYLQKIECAYPTKMEYTHIGRRNPAYCTSAGQAILAFEEKETIDFICSQPLKKFAPNTITSPDELRKKLLKVQNEGYVVSNQEFQRGIIGIAAPIFNEKNKVIASVNITGPIKRINAMNLPQLVKKVVNAGERISVLIKQRKQNDSFSKINQQGGN
ncbi:IclR family transcriptional regulator [Bacillus alveayuensis]|uniref:DNA-binding IclR family transcriptional regulator n=1 Tax=Aeribacillus alveayuensis TaxID=279215 RepID=A0ABT9VQ65_9BACI|nr:IclR family transcriptional regulator [Bacillus alveayuensis]MDQ0163119.1 DNA-binding IclR family transcriptional regulator [Bacillus alveayuensis]